MTEPNTGFCPAVLHHLKLCRWPTTKGSVAQVVGISTREVEECIQALRLADEPICSDERGYWYSEDPEELRRNWERLKGRVKTQAITCAGARRAWLKRLARMDVEPSGQKRLFSSLESARARC